MSILGKWSGGIDPEYPQIHLIKANSKQIAKTEDMGTAFTIKLHYTL